MCTKEAWTPSFYFCACRQLSAACVHLERWYLLCYWMADNISLDHIRTDQKHDLISMYENNDDFSDGDNPFQYSISSWDYNEPEQFRNKYEHSNGDSSYFHLNCRGLSSNWDSFHTLLWELHGDNFAFDFLGISELYRCSFDMRISLPGYHNLIARFRENGPRGGVGLFIKETINDKIREDLSVFIPHFFNLYLLKMKMQ